MTTDDTSKPETKAPTVCPDCGSSDYWHEWTNAHNILRTACCGKLYRVLPGNKLEAVPSENTEISDG